MGQAATSTGTEQHLECIVDEVIAAAGGDARQAILGLVRGQHELLDLIRDGVSAGYVRRGLARQEA